MHFQREFDKDKYAVGSVPLNMHWFAIKIAFKWLNPIIYAIIYCWKFLI